MKDQPGRHEATLDDAVAAVRNDEAPAPIADVARARAWDRIAQETGLWTGAVESIRGCADVQALLPAHREGTLRGPQALLVEDHLSECATCRAMERQPGTPRLAVVPWRPGFAATTKAPAPGLRRYAVGASILLAVGASAFAVRQAFFAVPPGSRAAVQSVSGSLQRVTLGAARALMPGEEVGEGDAVRTARGSQALLRLRDGSVVEMGERAELSVTARGRDTTLHLGRGSIIVQAAKRRVGRLLVASSDCTVYVTGTVFSVNSALKGSRVSVIEGEVRVVQGSGERRLHPGDQVSTNPTLGRVSLAEEIAWSRDADKHLALLAELQELRKDLEAVHTPGLRYDTRLLGLIPPTALIYASLPNYGEALAEAHKLFESRLQSSPILKEWWDEADPQRHGGPGLGDVIEKVRSFADYLGDEVVFTAVSDGRRSHPVLLADVRRPGFREFLEAEVRNLDDRGAHGVPVRLLDEDGLGAPVPPGKPGLLVLIGTDLMAVGEDAATLRLIVQRLHDGSPGLDRTAFGQRIAAAYRDGAGLLFAADIEGMARAQAFGRATRGAMGHPVDAMVLDLRHFVAERKEVDGHTVSGAVLTFGGPRRGIASWLGAPAPMGSLEFVSANAATAGAFIVKSPALLLDDIESAMGKAGGDHQGKTLAEIESHLKLRLREDLAETLGGEFAFALDGPLLPVPSWKVVAEVYDPERLQSAIQSIAGAVNEEAARRGRPGLRLEAEQVGSRTYHSIRAAEAGFPVEVHYAFVEGYLVAAPSRALVMRAIQIRERGETLARSERFRSLFPADGRPNVSALAYQNLGSLVNALVEGAGSAGVGSPRADSIGALARDARPSLVYAYGDADRIQVAGNGSLFDLDPASAALPMLMERLMPGTPARRTP